MSVILQDLIFSHHEDDTLLNIPRWEVASGEKVFLEGESGSGKSTLLNLIAGILPPTSGQIALLGERLERLNQRQRDRFRAILVTSFSSSTSFRISMRSTTFF